MKEKRSVFKEYGRLIGATVPSLRWHGTLGVMLTPKKTYNQLQRILELKEGGWIGWHDYRHSALWAGVTKAVREIDQAIGGGIIHVSGTTTALLQVTAEMKSRMGAL